MNSVLRYTQHMRAQRHPNLKQQTIAPPLGRWFWQRSLQGRIILTYGLLFLVMLVALLFYVGQEIYGVQIEQAEHGLEVSAFLIANALEDPLTGYAEVLEQFGTFDTEGAQGETSEDEHEKEAGQAAPSATGAKIYADDTSPPRLVFTEATAQLQAFVNLYIRDETERVTVIAVDGTIIADSDQQRLAFPNQLATIEVAAALRGAEQHNIRLDTETGELTLYAAVPVQQGRKILCIIRLARALEDVLRPTQLFLLKLVGGSLLALLLTSVIGLYLSRYLVRPLHKLAETAQRIAQGDLNQVAPVETADEVGTVASNFNDMVARLRDLLEQQRQFVANASHELRTPLTNIKLRSEAILASEEELSVRAKRYLIEIDNEADRLRRLANTLLNLASLEQETPQHPVQAVDPLPLLWEVIHAFQMAFQQAGLTLVCQLPAHLPALWLWPDHLMVIVNNLLDNALKYAPTGSEVCLTVTYTAQDCVLQIQNSGEGIPAEDLPYIFERFYRVDKARSRRAATHGDSSGAGLGLAIVKSLVAINDGTITVENTAGNGVGFTVKFPIASVRDAYVGVAFSSALTSR